MNRARRAAIIYNPVARKLSRDRRLLQRTIDALSRLGIQAALVSTSGPGNASILAKRQIEAGCDLIIAAGGDGTINEAANGMLHTGVPLAILPGGTANVLAREMRIPTDFVKAAQQIPHLTPVRVAAGLLRADEFTHRSFLCMAGVGLDAEIVSNLNLDLKAAAGKLAYYVGGLSQIFRPLKEFEVLVDGKSFQASFALMSRVRNYGGDLEIARGASLLRNEFEVVLFRGTQSAQYLPYLVGVAAGRVHRMNGCTVLRGRSVCCRPLAGQSVYVQADGELIGKLPMSIDLVPDALTLMLPAEFLTREQSFSEVAACA